MNMISQLRQRVQKEGKTEITLEEFNQLQGEWITRTKMEEDKQKACPVEQLVIKRVICSHVREDCDGCNHATEHEPIVNMKQEVCTDTDKCAFHERRVQCINVL